jgi:glycosyltransferase involved in cell wall biosynthesis
MKILLSAYACEPNRGSEPAVGWNWAIQLARLGINVWVLTRANNKGVIENEFKKKYSFPNLHFIYYDLPKWAMRAKKNKGGVYLYYLFWQWGAYQLVNKFYRNEKFDCIHHITFVSIRQPSFLGNLGVPFIFGPVAGGEATPWKLRKGYPLRGLILDMLRDVANFCVRYDPFMRKTFRQAKKIITTSIQTKKLVPEKYHFKTNIRLAIGIKSKSLLIQHVKASSKKKPSQLKILYVGRFVYWKGMHLGLPAFARIVKRNPDIQLTMVGDGPEKKKWEKIAKNLRISNNIKWFPWVDQNSLFQVYKDHDIFFFPSLHDSGGMVVLEAMANGLPVICLDLGGPGTIVTKKSGIVIPTFNATEEVIIKKLGEAIQQLMNQPNLIKTLSYGALEAAKSFAWNEIVKKQYLKMISKDFFL